MKALPAGVRMQCIECDVILPMDDLVLLHPTQEDSKKGLIDAWTSEPDFFCRCCVNDLRLDKLPELDKLKWFNGEYDEEKLCKKSRRKSTSAKKI